MTRKKKVLAGLALATIVPVAFGLTGCAGEKGERGYRGTHWTIGQELPSGNHLKKGDIHLRPSGAVYKYTAEGVGHARWEYKFTLTGPAADVPGAIQAILNVEEMIASATTTAEINAAIEAYAALNELQRGLVSNFHILNNKVAGLVQFIGTYTGASVADQEAQMNTLKTTGVTRNDNVINVQLAGTHNRAVVNFGQIAGLTGTNMHGTVTPYTSTVDNGTTIWTAGTPLYVKPLAPYGAGGEEAAANLWRPYGETSGAGQTAIAIQGANPGHRLMYIYPTNPRIAFSTPAYFNQNTGRVRVQLTGHNGVTFTFILTVLAPAG